MKAWITGIITGAVALTWEHWLAVTEKTIAGSTVELLQLAFRRLLKGKTQMEKDIKLAQNVDLDLKIAGGVASVSLVASYEVPGVGLKASSANSVELSAAALIDKIFAAIEAKSPPGVVALEEGVKLIVKNAAMAL